MTKVSAADVRRTLQLFTDRGIPVKCIGDGGISKLLAEGLTPEQIVTSICGQLPIVLGVSIVNRKGAVTRA